MKLTLIAAVLLAAFSGAPAAIRFEADGVRVGSELVTGAVVSLKESGATPLLVSGAAVESLSGGSLAVSLGAAQVDLGAGLRLSRTADGFRLSTHGMPFKVEASGKALDAAGEVSFKVTDKGFDFGVLGALDGSSFAARVVAGVAPAVAADPQEVKISPAKDTRQGVRKTFRRLYTSDPLLPAEASSSVAVRQIGRVTPDAAP